MRPWYLPALLVPAVAGCTAAPRQSPPHPVLPTTIENGLGSALGNYGSVQAGTIIGPEGTPCPVFVWDRPLSDGRVLRLRSASCAFAGRPGGLIAIELDRTIIPFAESTLAAEAP
jgi:hypothetical protein